MMKSILAVSLATAGLGLAACTVERDEAANQAAAPAGDAGTAAAPGTTTAAVVFPRGARIVEEDGVTFRIDPDGTRIRLGDADSRIVVEDDVRFRVDPDGTRVRIGPDGAELQVDDNVRATVEERGPAVEINNSR